MDEEVRATLLKDVQKQEASIGNKVLPKASSPVSFLFTYCSDLRHRHQFAVNSVVYKVCLLNILFLQCFKRCGSIRQFSFSTGFSSDKKKVFPVLVDSMVTF